jgi:PAS domain S-box-containing protein
VIEAHRYHAPVPSTDELERRAALLELTTDLVASATPDGVITYLNASGRALLGWAPHEDASTKRIRDFHPPWALDVVLTQGLPVAMREGVWRGETALLTQSGGIVPVSQVIVAHRDAHGEVVHLSTIMRDIRERKRIEEQLRAASRMLQLVLNYIPQFVFWKDTESVYRGCNRNFAEAAGVASVEDIVGKTDHDLAWSDEAELRRALDRRVMGANQPQTHLIESRPLADGRQAWLDTSKIPLHDEAGRVVGILGMYEDITARREAEEQLRQTQKLESIGQLAGGVAHDFNNMLTVICGSAELLAMGLDGDPGMLALAEEIIDATDAAAGLTQKLLDFSRKGAHSRAPLDAHAMVKAALALLERTVDRRIRIVTALAATQTTVMGDPSQLQNLLLNLGLNARDAMPEGGELHISTDDVTLDAGDPRCGAFELEPGPHLEITVRDWGVGMTPGVASRVFEPFFTTKDVGAGTGLGLAAVYSAVIDHRGAIGLTTAPGKGTSFTIYLPIAIGAKVHASVEAAAGAAGCGRVLLVDDEEMVRNVASVMLTTLGYEVLTAEDGEQALALFIREHASIDLVILDMIMPKLGGRETFEAMREVSPEVAVLFSSGFTRERAGGTIEGGRGFIKKPYRFAAFARQVADAIARDPSAPM